MNTKTGYPAPVVFLEQSNEEEKEADEYSPYPKGSTEREGDGSYPKGRTPEGGDINMSDMTTVRPYDKSYIFTTTILYTYL
jgi:protein tyrosine/serine phosphatase